MAGAVAHEDQGLLFFPGELGIIKPADLPHILRGGKKGQPHGKGCEFFPERLRLGTQLVVFLPADHVGGLDDNPFKAFRQKAFQSFGDRLEADPLFFEDSQDHAAGKGPPDLPVRIRRPDVPFHRPDGLFPGIGVACAEMRQ